MKRNHLSFTAVYLFLILASFSFGCNQKENKTGRELIAGNSSKTWHASKLKNAAGNKESLSKEERQDVMQFYANGTFTINTANQANNGTWTFNDNTKTLSLQFPDENVTQNFQVTDISEKEMQVRAGDGTDMTLRAQ
ncbi:hypothetical protein BH24BAC1_BH24BAC1_06260 [soil metagenome]